VGGARPGARRETVGDGGWSRTGGVEEQRRRQTVGAATVGGMTPWVRVDKRAVGKPGRAGRTRRHGQKRRRQRSGGNSGRARSEDVVVANKWVLDPF
jgi:hypothetical protein